MLIFVFLVPSTISMHVLEIQKTNILGIRQGASYIKISDVILKLVNLGSLFPQYYCSLKSPYSHFFQIEFSAQSIYYGYCQRWQPF